MRDNLIKGKQACLKDEYPPSTSPESKCKELLKKVENVVPKPNKEDFENQASIIEITEGSHLHVCYRDQIWKEHGWCEVEGSTPKKRLWGICSSSCPYFHSNTEKVVSTICIGILESFENFIKI